MKKLLLISFVLSLFFSSQLVFAQEKVNLGRSPAVIDAEIILEYDPSEEFNKKEPEVLKNKISLLVGFGVVDSTLEIDPDSFEFYSEEENGLVAGLEYGRNDVFSLLNHSFNILGQIHSNQTLLLGLQSRVWKIDVALLGGLGIIKHESKSSSGNIMNPEPTEINKHGLVGGVQLSIPVYQEFSVLIQGTTNKNILGGLGMSF